MAVIKSSLELTLRRVNQDDVDQSLRNALYGFNSDFSKRYMHPSRNNQGFTFFVRPQLNLADDNIRFSRLLYGNMGSDAFDIPTFVRHTLDPRVAAASDIDVINNKQAYIPLLTNSLLTLSGFPDIELPTTSSEPGLLQEVYTLPDGATDNYGPVEISTEFLNTTGDPIQHLFHTWTIAISLMVQGKIRPYPDFISEHERCFDTRIFRIILDQTGRFVRKVAATGPGFIDNVGVGQDYDYNHEKHYSDNVSTAFRFKMAGAEYRDPILIYEFNKIGEIFNPDLSDEFREKKMAKVPLSLRHAVNHLGYPRIDEQTMEFEYWIDKTILTSMLDELTPRDEHNEKLTSGPQFGIRSGAGLS